MILECIPEYKKAEEWAGLSEKYGLSFEYNEFFNPAVLEDENLIDEIVGIYNGLGRDGKNDTLHGAFLDITVSSSDPMIRNASDYRVSQSLEIASRLNARGVVFHTNYLTDFKSSVYRQNWVDSNIKYWGRKCHEYGGLNIFLENMFDNTPELLAKVAAGLSETENFGVCLDLAHAFLSRTALKEWIEALSGHVMHIHINDNDGLEDLHLSVGAGKMDWNILKEKALFDRDPSVLIEVSGREKLETSYEFLKENKFLNLE
ncbi:MAG: sugar phosphate isomerase/epimerase [Lachnospiraceae bacterium]|nr:sugar phosphate isomerase/epimerase [Lachnospiraceae bacterium]